MNILIIIGIIFLSIGFIIIEKVLLSMNRKLKNDNAYIRWQLDWYKEQNDKLYKILMNLDRS